MVHERLGGVRMRFSTRTNWNLVENELAAAVRRRRSTGLAVIDLTVSNPTRCGFRYDQGDVLGCLEHPGALEYDPDPLGMMAARRAVSDYYRDGGAKVDPEQICLTTSTSEAYSFLFRLLCNAGDEVLAAGPSYPLFDYLARLDDVELREYPLFYDPNASVGTASSVAEETKPDSDRGLDRGLGAGFGEGLRASAATSLGGGLTAAQGWWIDLHALKLAITDRTRAILVVHPNNPTGNYVSAAEREALEALCVERGLVLIVDEVFLDYSLDAAVPSFMTSGTEAPGCLTFVLSGLSKICGLPQMKASWIAARGPGFLLQSAMERLEVIADTYLSMNAPIQYALPGWLAGRARLQEQVRERMRSNLAFLDRHLRGSCAGRLAMQGGWTVVLRVPRTVGSQEFALAALERGVLVQPGDFYGMGDGRAILSLLTPPEQWEKGLDLLPVD
ncbi:MAG: pyridoxal phosphate-dependent aminotransferase [Acidobacteriaceae bacterium]